MAETPTDANHLGGYRERAVRASGIWMVTYTALQAIRIGSQIVLAALLSPQIFGVVRLALTAMQGLKMCSEVGVRESIIQNERGDDPEFLNTAWSIQIARGVVIWILATSLAWPFARFYDQQSLVWILPAISVIALINGFNSTAFIQLNRTLREGPRAALELTQAIITRGVMIVWAYYISPTAWALVAGSIAGALVFAVISHTLPGHRNRLGWDRRAAGSILRFGSWIFVGTIIAFLGQQLDGLMLGKLEAISLLGVYSIALTIARIPNEIVGVISGHVLYPVLASIARNEPSSYARRLLRIRSHVLPIGAAAVLGVIALAPWFFRLLYDSRYSDAEWIAPLACGSVWVMILNSTVNRALLALGHTRLLALAGFVRVVTTAAAAGVGFYLGGVTGFVIGVFFGTLCEHVLETVALARLGISVARQDIVETAWAVVLATGIVLGNNLAMAGHGGGWELTVGLALVAILVVTACARAYLKSRHLIAEAVLKIRDRRGESPTSEMDDG